MGLYNSSLIKGGVLYNHALLPLSSPLLSSYSRLFKGFFIFLLWTLVLDLIGTWLGLGLGGFGTKGLGTGLDNNNKIWRENLVLIKWFPNKI